jgi:hypothetical protein
MSATRRTGDLMIRDKEDLTVVLHEFKGRVPNCFQTLMLFASPKYETSLAKGIPATPEYLQQMKMVSKILAITIKYRGPRRPGFLGQATCLKKDATSFAVYLRG